MIIAICGDGFGGGRVGGAVVNNRHNPIPMRLRQHRAHGVADIGRHIEGRDHDANTHDLTQCHAGVNTRLMKTGIL